MWGGGGVANREPGSYIYIYTYIYIHYFCGIIQLLRSVPDNPKVLLVTLTKTVECNINVNDISKQQQNGQQTGKKQSNAPQRLCAELRVASILV